jgi:hypothetical protein
MRRPAGGEVSPTADIADEARVALGRLRAAWSWLAEAVHPGTGTGARPTRHRRQLDDDQQQALDARYRYERRAYLVAVHRGAKPSAPHAIPVNAGAVEARQHVAGDVAALAARMWEWVHGLGLVLTVNERGRTVPCGWCDGTGHAQQPDDWPEAWPEHPIVCSMCRGRTVMPAGNTCQACTSTTGCHCDRHDVVVALSLDTVAGLLDHLGAEPLTITAATLDRAADRAEQAAGAGQDRRRIPGTPRCPACGTRELYAEVSSPDPREWAIRCGYTDCLCEGPFCPCRKGTDTREGRRHVWPARLWDGPAGLADLLGVAGAAARATFEQYVDELHDQATALHLHHLYRDAAARGRTLPITAREARRPCSKSTPHRSRTTSTA